MGTTFCSVGLIEKFHRSMLGDWEYFLSNLAVRLIRMANALDGNDKDGKLIGP